MLAGVGIVWVNDIPYEPQMFKLGSQSLQYAKVASVLITLQLAVQGQQGNQSNTELFAACEHLVETHNMRIYWKKVKSKDTPILRGKTNCSMTRPITWPNKGGIRHSMSIQPQSIP
ncbi:hypothetical protein NFI96_024790 [Prochilodus magdalenae]|nr:hypothetical protein NFI96_024790 [Prochilodus magdalenae]